MKNIKSKEEEHTNDKAKYKKIKTMYKLYSN